MPGPQDFVEFPRNRHEASIQLLHLCQQFIYEYNAKIAELGHFDNPYECVFLALHNYDGQDFAGLAFPNVDYDPTLTHLGKAFLTHMKKHMRIPPEQRLDKHQAQLIYDVLQVLSKLPEEEMSISDADFWALLEQG